MQKYKKCHTDIKSRYALGIQNEILPEKSVKEIPCSTSFYWKDLNAEEFVGNELASGIQNNLDDTKIFLDSRLYFSRKAFVQFARLYLTFVQLLGKENTRKVIKANRNVFCRFNRKYFL